jgi:hypothetical protein
MNISTWPRLYVDYADGKCKTINVIVSRYIAWIVGDSARSGYGRTS